MPETYGLPEEEEEQDIVNEAYLVVAESIAGKGILRTVVLYALTAVLVITPVAPLAIVPLILLIATDGRLSA
jgi:hypothetical protein